MSKGQSKFCFYLCNKNLSVKIYFSLNRLQGLFSDRFTVHVENNLVSKYTEVKFVPLRVKYLIIKVF